MANPAIVDGILGAPRNAVSGLSLVDNGANDFNRSLRDVLNPMFRDGSDPAADSFQRLTYGGYLLRQGLSQSVRGSCCSTSAIRMRSGTWAPDGLLKRGDPDQGVPVGQVFYPPYLFKAGGVPAARPAILTAPREIQYRGHLDVKVAGAVDRIGSVALLRSDHNTHSLTTGDRYVKLAFEIKGDPRKNELRVVSPKLPAQAVPGVYMLFVLDKEGVPSAGVQVRLKPETRGASVEFR